MNRTGKMGAVWLAFVGASAFAPITTGAERRVLIVAGQSNVLNWHADAAALPRRRDEPAPAAPQTLDPSSISQISFYILDKQQGPFELTVSAVGAGG